MVTGRRAKFDIIIPPAQNRRDNLGAISRLRLGQALRRNAQLDEAASKTMVSRNAAARQFALSVSCDFESFVYRWYAALVFVPLYNFFARRQA